jgi:acyl-ACP thioesterase
MDGDLVTRPAVGRTFRSLRRVRLDDRDVTGRVRLDALARFMQDAAIDDVDETGWGAPEHLWFVRRMRVDVVVPFAFDRELELVTWCSGSAPAAAGRRWSIAGDGGGRAEVDSVWIHLDGESRPARIDGFGVYAEAAGGRGVSTRLVLPGAPAGAARRAWPLRATDVDVHGHVNNAVVWQAVEDVLADAVDLAGRLRTVVEFRRPLDLDDAVEAASWRQGAAFLSLEVEREARASARLETLAPAAVRDAGPPASR